MTKQRRISQIEATAYHEAGHAVVAVDLDLGFRRVSIEPAGDSLGHILYRRWRNFDPQFDCSQSTWSKVERIILCSLAGPAAEKEYLGRYNHRGAKSDYDHATRLGGCLHDGEVLNAYFRYMRLRATAMVTTPHTWARIEGLANALLTSTVLTFEKAEAVMKDSFAEAMRTRNESAMLRNEREEQ